MGRGGRAGFRRSATRRVRPRDRGSDESDEDYRVGEDEERYESDEECSLDADESEESCEEYEEEEEQEEQEEEKKVKKVVRSKAPKHIPYKKRSEVQKVQKKRRVSYKEEDDDDNYEDEDEDEDEDEEFSPDEFDSVDDGDELPVIKKNKKLGRTRLQEKVPARGQKRKRNPSAPRKPMRKKPGKNLRLRRKGSSNNGRKSAGKNLMLEGKRKKLPASRRRRRLVADSDSDFVSSGPSDDDYTISEEEREQVREASEFFRSLNPDLRSSSLSKRLQEQEALCPQRKSPSRKGKEKVEELKIEVGKQVCGICLSEEGTRTVRGTLNCCSHFFCFACIMEWSKVESRCPLCKQRFVTISKPARSDTGFDLRTIVIQVPERDQVYQPSEEELRGYLDPYENVICTECQQGGDDAFMLLCDLCDSPAHTYCVGLRHEVPDGNWYCEGCRPTALVSADGQSLNPTPDRRTNNMSDLSSPAENVGRGIDLNVMYVPETPLTQDTVSSPPRRPGDSQTASPASGPGAFTVSERRRIQRQIQHLLNSRLSQFESRSNGISANAILGFQLGRRRETASQPERTLYSTSLRGRSADNSRPLVQSGDGFSLRSNHLSRGQLIEDQTRVSFDVSSGVTLTGTNSVSGYDQLRPCTSRSSIGADASVSSYGIREVSYFPIEKDKLQSMVRSHLKCLSRDIKLGFGTFKDIARSSTHTILAACRIEHRTSEVHPLPFDPPPICHHKDRIAPGQMCMMVGCCCSCLDSFVRKVVREVLEARIPEQPGGVDSLMLGTFFAAHLFF